MSRSGRPPPRPRLSPRRRRTSGCAPIETRIEARRVDTLRADPPLTARRPIFPHIEPEEWDVPPMVAARAGRERRGTGWAIGLGSLLLIAGITAPAAIWQQGRQVQDQVALVTPAPATQQTQATPSSDGHDDGPGARPGADSGNAAGSAAARGPAIRVQRRRCRAAIERAGPGRAQAGSAGSRPRRCIAGNHAERHRATATT